MIIALINSRFIHSMAFTGLPEMEDSDEVCSSSVQSTPSPHSGRHFQTLMPPSSTRSHSSTTFHPSLRKKRWQSDRQQQQQHMQQQHQQHLFFPVCDPFGIRPEGTLEKSWSLQVAIVMVVVLLMLNLCC